MRCVTVNKLHGDGVVRYMLRSLAVTFLSVHEKHLLILHGCQIPRNADRVAASGALFSPNRRGMNLCCCCDYARDAEADGYLNYIYN